MIEKHVLHLTAVLTDEMCMGSRRRVVARRALTKQKNTDFAFIDQAL
jgi:hypothetical protein